MQLPAEDGKKSNVKYKPSD